MERALCVRFCPFPQPPHRRCAVVFLYFSPPLVGHDPHITPSRDCFVGDDADRRASLAMTKYAEMQKFCTRRAAACCRRLRRYKWEEQAPPLRRFWDLCLRHCEAQRAVAIRVVSSQGEDRREMQTPSPTEMRKCRLRPVGADAHIRPPPLRAFGHFLREGKVPRVRRRETNLCPSTAQPYAFRTNFTSTNERRNTNGRF